MLGIKGMKGKRRWNTHRNPTVSLSKQPHSIVLAFVKGVPVKDALLSYRHGWVSTG